MGVGWRKLLVLAAGLLVAGAARLPFEEKWSAGFERAGLLQKSLETRTRAKVGQTFYAVALGGLRTLVATFFNLRAFGHYEDLDWDGMAETYETMFALAPRTGEYWFSGAHHQAMNAASYYRNDGFLRMSPAQREEHWRASVLRGRDMLERGVRNVPDDYKVQGFLGYLLTDKFKYRVFGDPDETFAEAARAYRAAADCPGALPYLRRFEMYALARVPARRAEALELARGLYANPGNRTPTLNRVYFALQVWANPGVIDPLALAVEIFGSEDAAYRELGDYWLRGAVHLPMDGVAFVVRQIEAKRGVPDKDSVLRKESIRETEETRGGREE
jgi:hypothetical protein